MGAFTGSPTSSTQHAIEVGLDGANKIDHRDSSNLRVKVAEYTHSAGAGTGEVNLLTLPAGRIRIYPDLCRLVSSQMAASADLHLGHRAYTQEDGTAVAEDDNEWADNLDAGGAAQDVAWTDGGTTNNVYDSQEGIVVYSLIDAGNIEDNDTIYVVAVFSGAPGN